MLSVPVMHSSNATSFASQDYLLNHPIKMRIFALAVFLPIVVWLKGPVLIQAQIFGLLVSQFCEMCIECREMKAGHILIWKARERRSTLTFIRSLWLVNLSNEEWKRSSRQPLGFTIQHVFFSSAVNTFFYCPLSLISFPLLILLF